MSAPPRLDTCGTRCSAQDSTERAVNPEYRTDHHGNSLIAERGSFTNDTYIVEQMGTSSGAVGPL